MAKQTRIVVEELEAVVAANLQRATRLRQSILQKAFSGELIPSIDPRLPGALTRQLRQQTKCPKRYESKELGGRLNNQVKDCPAS